MCRNYLHLARVWPCGARADIRYVYYYTLHAPVRVCAHETNTRRVIRV